MSKITKYEKEYNIFFFFISFYFTHLYYPVIPYQFSNAIEDEGEAHTEHYQRKYYEDNNNVLLVYHSITAVNLRLKKQRRRNKKQN